MHTLSPTHALQPPSKMFLGMGLSRPQGFRSRMLLFHPYQVLCQQGRVTAPPRTADHTAMNLSRHASRGSSHLACWSRSERLLAGCSSGSNVQFANAELYSEWSGCRNAVKSVGIRMKLSACNKIARAYAPAASLLIGTTLGEGVELQRELGTRRDTERRQPEQRQEHTRHRHVRLTVILERALQCNHRVVYFDALATTASNPT